MSIDALQNSYDVIVAGGGPAGAASAALLASHGHSVLLVERSSIPRFHVGESLIPAANDVLNRLGMIDEMLASDFPKKHSVQFVTASDHESAPFYFDEFESTGLGHTWQVVRSEFDRMLLENAKRKGATCVCNTQLRCTSANQPFSEFELIDSAAGKTAVCNCRVFVDATGQSTLVGSKLGIKQVDPVLKNATVWTHYKGARRDLGRDSGATIILSSADKQSWFWYIPLPENIVSVGCTGSLEYMFRAGETAADVFARELSICPALQRRLHNAERVEPFRTTKDFSYKCKAGSGNGWVLVGDAYGFIDPVYSSGVFLALKSAEMAADTIHDALNDDDLSAARLGSWQSKFDNGVTHFRRLVHAFYDVDFNFGHFLKHYPQHRNRLINVLVGNVFTPGIESMFVDIDNDVITSNSEVTL